jgi:hypothetical protein
MISRNSILSVAASAAVLAVASISAQALTLNGTYGFSPFGGTGVIGPTDLTTATSLDFTGAGVELVSQVPLMFNGKTNDFAPGGNFPFPPGFNIVSLSTPVLTDGGQVGLTFTAGGTPFAFTPSTTIHWSPTMVPNGTATTFSEFGIVSDGGAFTPQLAQFTGTFTEPLGGGAIAGGFTFSSPPATIPEPGNVAMLAGMGLTGASFLARRRNRK